MSDFHPNFDQIYAYYSARLPEERMAKTRSVSVRCPFHGDKNPSMGINLEAGVWKCHVCNEGGGMLLFEQKLSPGADLDTCWRNIYQLCGMPQPIRNRPESGRQLTATYDYCDPSGKLLYQKLRYEYPDKPKSFSQRQPGPQGKGWEYNLNGVKKVLYRLPEVITSRLVFVVEGEKDADNLLALLKPYQEKHAGFPIAVTCNFDGAGKWIAAYNAFFAGRIVVILADNDKVGKDHAQKVAAGVKEFAVKVLVPELPGLEEHGDVSDWIKAGGTTEQLFALVKKTPVWTPEYQEHTLLVELLDFFDRPKIERQWLIKDVIPAKTTALLLAEPKAGKSLLTFDLALALSSGSPWLNFPIEKRSRVALISREDSPDESEQRLRMLMAGDIRRQEYNWGQIWLNTKDQSPIFLVDNAEHINELIRELQMEQIDLAIFDVFGKIHNQDENDNTAINAHVVRALERIQTEASCGVLVVHHLAKEEQTNVFKGARGATSIHGFAEWGVALTVVDASQPRRDWVRKVDFELKYGCPADPVYFSVSGQSDISVRIDMVDKPEQEERAPRRQKVRQITGGGGSWHDRQD